MTKPWNTPEWKAKRAELIKDKTDPGSFVELPEIKQVSNTIDKFIEWGRRNDVN